MFINEAGFNLHTQRNHGCSRRGTPAKGTIPTAKGVTITILGAISDAGVTDITEHFLAYVSNVMDVLDKNNMQGTLPIVA